MHTVVERSNRWMSADNHIQSGAQLYMELSIWETLPALYLSQDDLALDRVHCLSSALTGNMGMANLS